MVYAQIINNELKQKYFHSNIFSRIFDQTHIFQMKRYVSAIL